MAARVAVEPSGVEFDVADGETVFEAARRCGVRWPTVCGGVGSCRTCFMVVVCGSQFCSAIDDWEAEGLADLATVAVARSGTAGPAAAGPVRLACQTRISGPVTVRKPGVR
ncbi:MAG: 2Fe-2S iron-sulfur cluster-binding protein [Acidimicrobiales bacterium]